MDWQLKRYSSYSIASGGMVVFLETLNEEKLLSFYREEVFSSLTARLSESISHEPHELIQLLKFKVTYRTSVYRKY